MGAWREDSGGRTCRAAVGGPGWGMVQGAAVGLAALAAARIRRTFPGREGRGCSNTGVGAWPERGGSHPTSICMGFSRAFLTSWRNWAPSAPLTMR